MSNLNWIDLVVLLILFLSVGAGLLRGFVREVIGVLAWLLGIIIASQTATKLASFFTQSPTVQATLNSTTETTGISAAEPVSLFAIGVSFIIIFVAILLIGKLIGYFFSGAVRLSGLGFIDGLFGGVFGLVRGVLVSVVFMFLIQLTPIAQEDYWQQSKFVNLFQPGVQWINNQVIPGFDTLKDKAGNTWQSIYNQNPTQFLQKNKTKKDN